MSRNVSNYYVVNPGFGGFLEDLQKNLSPLIESGQKVLDQRADAAIQDMLKTQSGKNLLAVVEQKATEGVSKQIKTNLPWLAGLTIAGGAIGGYVLKGSTGAMVGGVILSVSIWKLMTIGK